MTKNIFGIPLLIGVLFIAGCIGGKSVETSYLRVGLNHGLETACEKVRSDLPTVAVKRFTSLPALDRETVILASGPVLTPDYRWSWEGTPSEIFDAATGPALGCMKHYEVIAPYRPGADRDLLLSGEILSFEVQQSEANIFKGAVRYSLWDGSGKRLLGRKLVEASIPVEKLNGRAIAVAASAALGSIMSQTAAWIDGYSKEIDH
ncbi:hypothetical protein [Desulfovibrio gilichinskyi]|uniref:ABC-type transport auxiliary lipoprotein component domain-containing protein n=1 Tax=Desulfovibrio gilichinskyi TaxID=1519643 RepID=A0A1X7E0T1_9BACT|nr:hypothetical protein [Desulfovibrio gilichinskyi]SMF24985.1 hypothetical protein SAMN06295933_2436 [Desulfovibrio gilichinskyi]